MSKTISINDEGRLVITEDGKDSVLTDEQCASFFDRPDTPNFMFTMYLFRTRPNDAKQWINLRLHQLQFIRTYLELQKKKEEQEDE